MGKNLSKSNLVTRSKKLAFWKLPSGVYQRMEGFTDLSYSQNPKEYSRQYVDEEFERTDIVGYSPSIPYNFDRYTGNEVLSDIVKITENEYIGSLAKRSIVTVDLSNDGFTASAKMREYTVIPDSSGDTTDCLTYSGTFKTNGDLIDCSVTTTDDWQTITVDTSQTIYRTMAEIVIDGDGTREPIVSGGSTHITGNVVRNTPFTITATAYSAASVVSLYRVTKSTSTPGAMGYFSPIKMSSSVGKLTHEMNGLSADSTFSIEVENGGKNTYYTIDLTIIESTVETSLKEE